MVSSLFIWVFGVMGLEEGGRGSATAKKCPVDIFLARGRIPSLRGNPVPKGETRS